jgi:CDP-diacylglycerol--serine O-phosphatidyltransferase
VKKPPPIMFVLPNLFTVSSIFCGFYAIVIAIDGVAADRFYGAAVAILFGVLFDIADGRVARLTKTQSDFGLQLDSLADVITFGLAPAVVAYKWSLEQYAIIGLVAAFLYVACGAIRLARFNVMAADETGPAKFFLGLPIPMAAATLMSLVMVHYRNTDGGELVSQPLILAVVLILAALMVSRVHYRTFKRVKNPKLIYPLVVVMASLLVVAAIQTSFGLIFALASAVFLTYGLIEEVVRFIRKRVLLSRKHEEEEEEA